MKFGVLPLNKRTGGREIVMQFFGLASEIPAALEELRETICPRCESELQFEYFDEQMDSSVMASVETKVSAAYCPNCKYFEEY